MIPALAPCFPGELAWYGEKLALPGEHQEVLAGRDLMEGAVLDRVMARFAHSYPGGERRALVSMWTQWHFAAAIIPTTIAILRLDRDLPVALDEIGLAPHPDGQTAALVLANAGKPFGSGTASRFSRLFEGHVAPLVARFTSHFGVSQRLLWVNAAAIFEWTVQQVEAAGAPAAVALDEARTLLERQAGSDGSRNPMCGAVRYPLVDGTPTRQRKVCCLRYLLPGVADCGSLCPLPEARRRPDLPPPET